MRTMLKAQFPVEAGNRSIKEGKISHVLESTLSELRPESAYFYAENGQRTCQMVFDLKQSSDIPRIAERFFMELNASVTLTPVMNAEELKIGLSQLK